MPSKEQRRRDARKKRTEDRPLSSLGHSSLSEASPLTEFLNLSASQNISSRKRTVSENFQTIMINPFQKIGLSTPRASRATISRLPLTKKQKMDHFFTKNQNPIDFDTLSSLHYAENIHFSAKIAKWAGLRVYEDETETSTKLIEKLFQNLNCWLNHEFTFAFLCMIASKSEKQTVVVDSVFTDPNVRMTRTETTLKNGCYNYDPKKNSEVILLPLFFQNHWALIIFDKEAGAFFIDSLRENPSRLDHSSKNYNPERVNLIKSAIFSLSGTEVNEIYAISESISQQSDLNSCGYFICLFSEAWLFNNRSLILEPIDLVKEKKRILWHLNNLYISDETIYHCRYPMVNETENVQFSRASSIFISSNNIEISDSSSSISSSDGQNRRGRPKKRRGLYSGSGRPKKIIVSPSQIPTASKTNIETINQPHFNDLLNIFASESIEFPISQPMIDIDRVTVAGVNKEVISSMWKDNKEMFTEDLIFAFQRYLTKVITNKKVVVVNPLYTDLNMHFGMHIFDYNALDNCYNYSNDYDILLMTIIFPGHFALIIFDRSDRENMQCLFIDSLPDYDRLSDTQYPLYDVRRTEIVKKGICELTPGLSQNDFNIQTLNQTEFTRQNDGINCGVFVILYSESYLLSGSMFLANLNINVERHRILWHLMKLLYNNDVSHIGRNSLITHQLVQNQPLPLYNVESVIDETCPRDGDAAFICVEPEFNTAPEVVLSPRPTSVSSIGTRRSIRLQKRQSSESSEKEKYFPKKVKLNEITQRCHLKHKGIPCADVRVKHTTEYYDSGNLGDKICDYCSALLFNSEAGKRNGKFSSSFCCNHGSVVLPPYGEHPPTLKRFLSGQDSESKEFLSHQNVYNSLLAFASISVGYHESSLDGDKCYLLNGEFTRKIGLLPGKFAPSFAQLYILDPMAAFIQRTKNIEYGGDRVNEKTIRKLDFIIRKYHPLAKQLMNFHAQYQKTLEEQGPESVLNFRLTLVEAREAPLNINDSSLHPRQTNLPDEGNSLFSIWAETDQPPLLKGIWITTDDGRLQNFRPHHPQTDSLCYPLIFPNGDDGFHPKIPYNIKNKKCDNEAMEVDVESDENTFDSDEKGTDDNLSVASSVDSVEKCGTRQFLSVRSYIRYRIALRNDKKLHHIWSAGGGLSQKFILDYSARIDTNVANYLRKPELNLRSTLPENALRWLSRNAGLNSTEELGSVVMYRRSEPGTRAYFQHKFYDATTIMSRFKRPGFASFFLTFTTNPRWPEISRNFLHQGQRTVDRPDLICRVYEDKLRHLHYLLDTKNILGKMIGQECREFQKKYGGPHAHRVYHTDLLAIPENVDGLIWAHIPPEPNQNDKSDWANFIRKVRELLPKYQFHDCGRHCLNHKGKCKKGFPKPFSKFTILHDDRPAIYFRPCPEDGGQTYTVKKGKTQITYDNSRVSAYNPYILVHFETHHNLEYAYGQSTNLKYLYKYPFKGPSFSYIKTIEENGKTSIDEPAYYARMLYRSSPEAYCRIMSLKYAKLSHTVIALSIHLPGQQKIYYKSSEKESVAQQIQAGILPETPLTAYWKMCETDPDVRKILFEHMPDQYSFNKSGKFWKKRVFSTRPDNIKNRKPIIGRIFPVSPRNPELFALYLLTKHFPGNQQQLKMVNPTHICETFLETARIRGLIDDNDVWVRTMEEGAASLTPAQMRQLLANILIFGSTENCLIDGALLWEKFVSHMFDTRCTDAERPGRIDHALALLEKLLVKLGKQCQDYGLPTPTISIINDPQRGLNEFFFPQHLNDDVDDTIDTAAFEHGKLNAEQQRFFDMVKNAFLNTATSRLFYLCGDGGTGKTFLLNYILFQLRKIGAKIIPTASTGMASTRFYVGGTTVHSAFKFGINVEPGKLPAIPFDSFFGRRIIESEIIIIDEMTMLERIVFENIDLLCRQLCIQKRHLPFGGKCVIISGDWKQSLPVVINSYGSAAQVAACIQSSPLYPTFSKYKLTQSMRVNPNEIVFLKWLDDVGRGINGNTVAIPKDMLVDSREELIGWVFDQGFNTPSSEMLKRLLLATTNRIVDINNSQISQSMLGNFIEYFSVDKATDENPFSVNAADFDVAQLNQLNPMGMPTHLLRLKIGSIVVLLVNLNTSRGLCNGTRLLIKKLTDNLIECETIGSGSSGNGIIIGIPRNRHTYKDNRPDGVSFERLQFPIRLAFAMTVVKAQGQTAVRLGIDFTEEPFAHGQLYTALSRSTSRDNIKIFAPNKPQDENGNPLIRNVIAPGLNLD